MLNSPSVNDSKTPSLYSSAINKSNKTAFQQASPGSDMFVAITRKLYHLVILPKSINKVLFCNYRKNINAVGTYDFIYDWIQVHIKPNSVLLTNFSELIKLLKSLGYR